MDDAQLGHLVKERASLQQQIGQVKSQLSKAGQEYEVLGQALQKQPERTVFANAPENLGSSPHAISRSAPSVNWDLIGDLRKVAQSVQQLHNLEARLRDVQSRLQGAGV